MGAPHLEVLFSRALDAVPDAVLVVDEDGTVVLANARCAEVFGREPDELVGGSIDELVPASVRSDHPRHREDYAADPHARPMGLLRLSAARGDGSEFPAEVSLAPVEAGGDRFVVVTVRDVTEPVRGEERFRNLLEGAPDPTLIVDADGRIVRANDRLCAVLGYDRGELLGRSMAMLAADPGREEVLGRFRDYLRSPSMVPMGAEEVLVRTRDGDQVPAQVSISPLQTTAGMLVSISLRDLTERREIEDQSRRLRDDLIATVSHELRTPLTSIIGYAELLADLDGLDVSGRARKLVEVIKRNAERELKLVDDLLTMAYLDDNRLRLHRTATDLREVASRVVADAALRARERGLTLRLVPPAAPVRPVHADPFRLVQVVENLVTNALKFTGPGGTVEVGVLDGGDRGVVEVRDTGIGVAPEERDRVFERLYRAPGAVTRQTPGAGLGLAIVRAIVEAHEGSVEVESEVGVGTVFRVALPYAD